MTNQPPDYDIFNDFDTWKTSLSAVNNPHNYKKNTELCENIKINSEVGNNPKEICKSFVRLFNILLANHAGKIGELKNKKYSDFMNYWLNQNLTDVAYHETTKNIIFQEIKKISCMFEAKDVLENKMYLMDSKHFFNFHILYKLYDNYDSLSQNDNYYNKFLEEMKCEYNNGLDKCFYSGDVKFCKALKKFRDDYEKSKNTKSKYCNGEDKICRSLPELNISSSVSHKEQLNIAKIGIGLIGTSYAPYLKGYSVDKSGEVY
ncbi:hypothetical protein PVMG_06172 [Plasmodium vivax Mauritania I]|uniref:Uncharacterized protein n=1 Tax=Plasmodium vivax Mauritania I TaxID=1035515 RepID=A0A0J9TJR7_PLAVI|nr:hypothetical protein PVMG_06172 [Plasmodium vivax Mauritania I]